MHKIFMKWTKIYNFKWNRYSQVSIRGQCLTGQFLALYDVIYQIVTYAFSVRNQEQRETI